MFSADQLLIPIAGANPSGVDMSFSGEFDAIAQARKFDDPSLDQGEWLTDLKEADWPFVVERCAALLAERTKDLRLAVWLAEAAAHQYRLRGLAEGLRVLAGLCERFWDDGLYPEAEDGDQDRRTGNLAWILARLPALVRALPLTEGRGSAYSSVDFDTARRRASSGNEPDDRPKLADMEAARRASSPAFVTAFRADVQYCLEALAELERAADARLGADSPGFSVAREAVRDLLHALPAAPAAASPAAVVHDAPVLEVAAQTAAVPVPQGPIRNRADALAQLRTVAQFFRTTEPHSPVSYFADKAADAGEQDLHTWLKSVVKDQGSLAHIEELLGVPPTN